MFQEIEKSDHKDVLLSLSAGLIMPVFEKAALDDNNIVNDDFLNNVNAIFAGMAENKLDFRSCKSPILKAALFSKHCDNNVIREDLFQAKEKRK